MTAQESSRPWTAVLVSTFLLVVVGGSVSNTYGLFAVEWVETMNVSRGTILLAGVLATLVAGLHGVMVGRLLASGFQERAFLCLGAISGAVAFAILAWTSSLWAFYLAYIVAGSIAISFTSQMVGQSRAVRTFVASGLPVSIVSLGMKIGAAAMPAIAAVLWSAMDLHRALLVMACMMALCAPVAWFMVPPVHRSEPKGEDDAPTGPAVVVPAKQILGDPVFIGILFIAVGVMAISSAFFFNLPFLMGELGADPAWAAYILSIATIVSGVSTPFVGMATDRFDLRFLLMVPIVLVAIVIVSIAASPPLVVVAGTAFAMTFANAFLFPCFPAMLRSRFGNLLFSRAIGLSQPFFYSAGLGAFFAGALRDVLGSYSAAFQVLGVFVLLAAVGWIFIHRALRGAGPRWPGLEVGAGDPLVNSAR
ncbi:MFS transporter [Novosphingobium pentaromativorans]|uniref:Major facilitator superfamily (MFS) profile domain-containing protein n=1 Tax=Novosphingobium pentaromativorans US6-1 TaxID=1088721 RepID=G6EGG0_9SPHN|nr:MFS transporter [Novosphingobium pentaromativorans]AIT82118.1 hypothetical protein JI59_21540 [Novosphingobium pentaromativorans US6-1]EHJ59611.1 hypothetical protein NSU_3494 [Novosphingobium pentaromativorans US6-1]